MNKSTLYKALFLGLSSTLLNHPLLATNISPEANKSQETINVAIDLTQDTHNTLSLPNANALLLDQGLLRLAKAGKNASSNSSPPANQNTLEEPENDKKIDCNYKITADTHKIDKGLVLTWSEHAIQQSFDLDSNAIEQQLIELKSCFTDQGWESFNDALQKSGNINAIKSQKLQVKSKVTGTPKISELSSNQWKINLPLEILYQNDKEKLNQNLSVDVIVGRKVSGDLGIIQLIAAPLKK